MHTGRPSAERVHIEAWRQPQAAAQGDKWRAQTIVALNPLDELARQTRPRKHVLSFRGDAR
jgi:hypothetical protein